jgi:rRNA maturation RNase YbeY
MALINYFSEDISFKLPKPLKTSAWIKRVVAHEEKKLIQLNYIFCSDDYLLRINQNYLNHKTLTDIVTFDNSGDEGVIEGDVFISIERVLDNATKLQLDFDQELHRVIIHGVLHLIGYADKSKMQKMEMRKKEDAYLSLR